MRLETQDSVCSRGSGAMFESDRSPFSLRQHRVVSVDNRGEEARV